MYNQSTGIWKHHFWHRRACVGSYVHVAEKERGFIFVGPLVQVPDTRPTHGDVGIHAQVRSIFLPQPAQRQVCVLEVLKFRPIVPPRLLVLYAPLLTTFTDAEI